MYSEDSEDDFATMNREKQEALLKKTWMDRERQFYGEEIEEDEVIDEAQEEEDAGSSEDELDRDATVKNPFKENEGPDMHDEFQQQIKQSEQRVANKSSHFETMQAKQR